MEDEVKAWLPDRATVEVTRIAAWESSEDDLQVEGRISIPEFSNVSGHRMFAPLMVFNANQVPHFVHAARTHPVYFGHSYRVDDDVRLELPDGFRIEAAPQSHNDINDFCHYETSTKSSDRSVDSHRSLQVNGFFYDRAIFASLRSLFASVMSHDSEQLGLEPTQERHAEESRSTSVPGAS